MKRSRPSRAVPAVRAAKARVAGSRPVEAMERRLLLSALPIVNAGFDALLKPGSNSITATLAAGTRTNGFGGGVAVVNGGGAAANAAYSDGTSGTSIDVPGWTLSAGAAGGVEDAPDVYPGKTDPFAYVRPNAQFNAFISQTLAGVSLQPNTTYTLTANVGSQGQATPDGSAFAVQLAAGGVELTPTSSSSPSPFPGTLPTASRTFVTGASPPSGDLTITLGLDASTDATEFDFDNVSLVSTPGSHPTPTPTPTPAITAAFTAPAITSLGLTTETITAVYSDPAGVDTSSLNMGNLQILAPDGSNLDASGFSATPASGIAPSVTATYTISAPFGAWTSADNGTYTVTLPAGELSDADTNTNAAATATFTIAAPGGPTANTVDPTFVGGGAKRFGFTAEAMASQPDGRLLVAGQRPASTSGGSEAVLERFNANGSVDTTFGNAGVVIDNADANEIFYGLVLQPDGKIVAAGTSGGRLLVARYNADGALDTTFASNGREVTPIGATTDATAFAVALNPADNGIVVTGSAGGQFLVDRFTARGAADPTFNGGSPLLFGSAADGDVLGQAAVASDGAIIAAGASAGGVVVARVTSAGALDTSFGAGGSGIASLAQLTAPDLMPSVPDPTEGLAVDSAGNILVANRTAGGDFATARLTPAGALDPAFGTAGVVITDFGGSDDADAISISGQRILVSGTTTAGDGVTRTAVAAYTPDGALDPIYADAGKEAFATGLNTATGATATGAAAGASTLHGGTVLKPDATSAQQVLQKTIAIANAIGLLIGTSAQGGAVPLSGVRRLLTGNASPGGGGGAPLPTGTLGAALSATRLPTSAVAGSKAKGAVRLKVTAPQAGFAGPVTVTLYLSENAQSLDTATQVQQFTRSLKLKPGQSRSLPATLTAVPSLPDGTYFLLASVQAASGDETAVAGPSLAIAAPFVKITASDLRPVGASASPGKTAHLTITLNDTGNEPAAGPVTLNLTASLQPAGPANQSFGPAMLKVKLKPSQTRTFRGKFKVPANTPAGAYTLSGLLNLSALGDTDAADGSVAGTEAITIR